MHILNYGLMDPKFYWKCQSKNFPDYPECKKINTVQVHFRVFKKIIETVWSLHNIVGMQKEKCRGAGRNCPRLFFSALP